MEIPGYKILSTLGKGGMATVYLAIQESFDRKVAIKVMSPELAQDPSFGDRFQREAKIVSQMNHPNIVTVYDVGVVNQHHYLAMQYVPGKELRYRFKDLNLPDKIRIIKEIASALNYAGNKGYVHRDVKPENVMLSEEDGRAMLMDFGIAKTTDSNHSMTKTGTAIGTPYYMSPEQAQGKPVDKRTDIYSLGIMFFQMLTGRVPYDAESQVAIGIKHITEPVPALPKPLAIFQSIINKVMAKDPELRYQTGADFIKDLDKISAADIEKVDSIAQYQFAEAARTDPNAATSLGEATPSPAGITGNIAAMRTQAAAKAQQNTGKMIPVAVAVVVVLLLAVVGWLLIQKKNHAVEAGASAQSPVGAPAAKVPEANNTANQAPTPAQPASQATPETPAAIQTQPAEAVHATSVQPGPSAQHDAAQAEKTRQQALAAAKAEQARQQAHQEVESRLNKAESLRSQGLLMGSDDNNAISVYRSVLEIDPGNSTATQGIKEVEGGYLSGIRHQIEAGNIEAATSKLREANKLLPNSVGVSELLDLLQKKKEELATDKANSTRPRVDKLLISDESFDSMTLPQNPVVPLSRTAYIGFSYQNFEGATSLIQAVLYDSSRTIKIVQKPVVVQGAQGVAFFTLDRPVEGFPGGGYSLDLYLEDQKLASIVFTVKH